MEIIGAEFLQVVEQTMQKENCMQGTKKEMLPVDSLPTLGLQAQSICSCFKIWLGKYLLVIVAMADGPFLLQDYRP